MALEGREKPLAYYHLGDFDSDLEFAHQIYCQDSTPLRKMMGSFLGLYSLSASLQLALEPVFAVKTPGARLWSTQME